MPIRPALAWRSMRGPQPAEVREVGCPSCGAGFEVSRKAMSATCPGCTRHLQFADLDLCDRMEGELATMGRVQVQAPSSIRGELTCGELTCAGRFDGRATVFGPLILLPGSEASGTLSARSLHVAGGAVLRGQVLVTPKPPADRDPRGFIPRRVHHPVRQAMRPVAVTDPA